MSDQKPKKKSEHTKQWWRHTIAVVAVYVIAGLLALLSLVAVFSADFSPEVFGYQWFDVSGSDMSSQISAGSLIYALPVSSADDLAVGDVVIYDISNSGVTMRFAHVIDEIGQRDGAPTFRTRDPGSIKADAYTLELTDIHAKYVGDLPMLGYLFGFIESASGLICLLMLVGLYTLSGYITRRISGYEQLQDSRDRVAAAISGLIERAAADDTSADTAKIYYSCAQVLARTLAQPEEVRARTVNLNSVLEDVLGREYVLDGESHQLLPVMPTEDVVLMLPKGAKKK